MQRGSYMLALLIAWLAIGCGSPTSSVVSMSTLDAGTGASFVVPASVGRISAAVNGTTPATLVVTNNGSDALMITVALDTNANSAHWEALECTTSACPLPAGQTLNIDLNFSPTEHGDLDTTIEVFGPPAIGSQTVSLFGTGVGGKLRVDQPPAPMFEHDFGTIAKNQLVAFQVEMTNIGNDDLEVTPGAVVAPFGVASTPVSISEGGPGVFDITCMSGTAMTQQTATVTLATDAYDQNTPSVAVKCAIANTTIIVTNPLAFQELRTGDTPGEVEVLITNPPGGGTVTINKIELVGAPNALTLTKPVVPAPLADGAQLMAKLALATAEDLVLENVTLEVEILEGGEPATLELPVTGKVGTPNAVVLPTRLDLGSVCVGTPAAGEIAMTNIGTATLKMQRPTMDSAAFVPLFTNPTDYPVDGAPLLPGDKATVGVMPTSTASGLQEGNLVWVVDAPGSPFTTAVSLTILMEGTAVSPGSLMFGAAAITEPPRMQQTITLENCGPDASTVRYGGVTAEQGTADAWVVEPPTQQRELLPDETMRVRVSFAPNQPGFHRARLAISVDGSESIIILEGDATGVLPGETSFYACGCSGSADPERGWPILLAFVFVVTRRRRATTAISARNPTGSS
ncbi:MAG: choice-of-anchor D domain-containing protein [Deltaproteobacteria bacterium]|nr:choice-of-anchor D domain-containing protein [Deltaproteobacteria bacterium]